MIIVLLGPTASGKSEVASILASKYKNIELINADAFQIYKDMDIGTAKIDKNDACWNRYHLLDIVEPSQSFSSFDYQKIFRKTIEPLLKENKIIVLVGGTGLYIRSALFDYEFASFDKVDLSKYDSLSDIELHDELTKLDDVEAKKIPYQNRKRVLRAIEIILGTGKKKSEMILKQKHNPIYKDVKFYLIDLPRETLYQRINERTKQIIDSGLVLETKNLLNKYELSETSKKAIGYEEAILYLNNEINLKEMYNMISKRTRNYAKRQMTFFRNQFDCVSFSDKDLLISDICKEIDKNG